MYKRYEACHLEIKKEPVYGGVNGLPGEEGCIYEDQDDWFRKCMNDQTLYTEVYLATDEEQILRIGMEDFGWYLVQKDGASAEKVGNPCVLAKALRWSNDPVGVLIPEVEGESE